jgi:hypothetical protein
MLFTYGSSFGYTQKRLRGYTQKKCDTGYAMRGANEKETSNWY